ncbi:hypothetical protein K2Y11_24315 [bacterium]|nr:hypothetical protein [bacterium]
MSTDLLADISYEELLGELGTRMSRLSAEATCSVWHQRADEELPRICYKVARLGTPASFDTVIVSVLEARLLVSIAERLGHWVTLRPGRRGWMPHVPAAMKVSQEGHQQ